VPKADWTASLANDSARTFSPRKKPFDVGGEIFDRSVSFGGDFSVRVFKTKRSRFLQKFSSNEKSFFARTNFPKLPDDGSKRNFFANQRARFRAARGDEIYTVVFPSAIRKANAQAVYGRSPSSQLRREFVPGKRIPASLAASRSPSASPIRELIRV
jgi:hypothetical protein